MLLVCLRRAVFFIAWFLAAMVADFVQGLVPYLLSATRSTCNTHMLRRTHLNLELVQIDSKSIRIRFGWLTRVAELLAVKTADCAHPL